jgi:type 1 glutamine amidotransferase
MKRILLSALLAAAAPLFAQDAKPLKVLLITGGCCHDYAKQKDILKKGIEERVNAVVDQVHTDDKGTKPPLAILGNPDYAKGYDVVIHDECAADVKDAKTVEGVLAPHRDGIGSVVLHCGVHSYRVGNPGKPQEPGTPEAMWFEFLGIQSSGHGPQLPITLTVTDEKNPVTKSIVGWVTGREELYNNVKVYDTAKALASGKQGAGDKPGQNDAVVVWTHEYGPKKTKVFTTTLGHNNSTVEDPKYLDLVSNGLLWAAGKLGADGKAAAGYGPKGAK